MIFITPLPPTTSEMTAISHSSRVSERLAFCTVCMMRRVDAERLRITQ